MFSNLAAIFVRLFVSSFFSYVTCSRCDMLGHSRNSRKCPLIKSYDPANYVGLVGKKFIDNEAIAYKAKIRALESESDDSSMGSSMSSASQPTFKGRTAQEILKLDPEEAKEFGYTFGTIDVIKIKQEFDEQFNDMMLKKLFDDGYNYGSLENLRKSPYHYGVGSWVEIQDCQVCETCKNHFISPREKLGGDCMDCQLKQDVASTITAKSQRSSAMDYVSIDSGFAKISISNPVTEVTAHEIYNRVAMNDEASMGREVPSVDDCSIESADHKFSAWIAAINGTIGMSPIGIPFSEKVKFLRILEEICEEEQMAIDKEIHPQDYVPESEGGPAHYYFDKKADKFVKIED